MWGTFCIWSQVLDKEKQPMPSVLLSLSGERQYRSNNITGDTGSLIFTSLVSLSFLHLSGWIEIFDVFLHFLRAVDHIFHCPQPWPVATHLTFDSVVKYFCPKITCLLSYCQGTLNVKDLSSSWLFLITSIPVGFFSPFGLLLLSGKPSLYFWRTSLNSFEKLRQLKSCIFEINFCCAFIQ